MALLAFVPQWTHYQQHHHHNQGAAAMANAKNAKKLKLWRLPPLVLCYSGPLRLFSPAPPPLPRAASPPPLLAISPTSSSSSSSSSSATETRAQPPEPKEKKRRPRRTMRRDREKEKEKEKREKSADKVILAVAPTATIQQEAVLSDGASVSSNGAHVVVAAVAPLLEQVRDVNNAQDNSSSSSLPSSPSPGRKQKASNYRRREKKPQQKKKEEEEVKNAASLTTPSKKPNSRKRPKANYSSAAAVASATQPLEEKSVAIAIAIDRPSLNLTETASAELWNGGRPLQLDREEEKEEELEKEEEEEEEEEGEGKYEESPLAITTANTQPEEGKAAAIAMATPNSNLGETAIAELQEEGTALKLMKEEEEEEGFGGNLKDHNKADMGRSPGKAVGVDCCIVKWVVNVKLKEGQQLFVSGKSRYLGSWKPSLAIPFSPSPTSRDDLPVWEAQIQVPYKVISEYNYLIQLTDSNRRGIAWRLGPRFRLSVPTKEEVSDGQMLLNDKLDFRLLNMLPILSWKHWLKQLGVPRRLGDFMEAGGGVQSETFPPLETTSPDTTTSEKMWVEEEEKKELFFDDNTLLPPKPPSESKDVVTTEEPWVLQPLSWPTEKEPIELEELQSVQSNSSPSLSTTSIISTRRKIGVPTEILINSSECSFQRLAILEEGKMVELLLEPVDSLVQVGDIYLGVVKKLLPGMTGVFVDIGAPQLCLLSITSNYYPYTFPSLKQSNNNSEEKDEESNSKDVGGDGGQEEEEDGDEEEEDDEGDEEEGAEEEETEEEEEVESNDYGVDDTQRDSYERGGGAGIDSTLINPSQLEEPQGHQKRHRLIRINMERKRPNTVDFGKGFTKWRRLEEGMKIIVQVRKEPLGRKGPKVSSFPQLSSRFWVMITKGRRSGISSKITGPERKRLSQLLESVKGQKYCLLLRTEAAGQSFEDLEKDLTRLIEVWKDIKERAKTVATEAGFGGESHPVLLQRAMGQTLSIVRDVFTDKVQRMIVDSPDVYHEVNAYLDEFAPHLTSRVELYTGSMPIFDAFNLEGEIEKILSERVSLPNGAYLVIQQTEALVSIDVNGGGGMLSQNACPSDAVLDVNLAAARQIAIQLRLRDIGGIIVVDFIDMKDKSHESLVYEEMRKAIQHDRSAINISEISELGLMEMTRERVRPSVSFMISESCSCCHGSGRVEAIESTLSKIEKEILRYLAKYDKNTRSEAAMWRKLSLRVDPSMFDYLSTKRRAAKLGSALKVYLILKIGRELSRGKFEIREVKIGSDKRHHVIEVEPKEAVHRSLRYGLGKKVWHP